MRLQLPRDFQLVQDTPRLVAFYLDPVDKGNDPKFVACGW